jgi:hypothetical protein
MAKCEICGTMLNKSEEKILAKMMIDVSPCMCSFAQEIYRLKKENKELNQEYEALDMSWHYYVSINKNLINQLKKIKARTKERLKHG